MDSRIVDLIDSLRTLLRPNFLKHYRKYILNVLSQKAVGSVNVTSIEGYR